MRLRLKGGPLLERRLDMGAPKRDISWGAEVLRHFVGAQETLWSSLLKAKKEGEKPMPEQKRFCDYHISQGQASSFHFLSIYHILYIYYHLFILKLFKRVVAACVVVWKGLSGVNHHSSTPFKERL